MTKLQRQVLEFHSTFGHPTADSPTIPADDRVRFRAAFIVEECLEFLEACFDMQSEIKPAMPSELPDVPAHAHDDLRAARGFLKELIEKAAVQVDLPLAVDALADIDYVVEGCRLEFGVNGEPIADAVHAANMTKLHRCPACAGNGFLQKNDHDSISCDVCLSTGRMIVKREDGKTLKPPGWTPPDIAGELETQRGGVRSLERVARYGRLTDSSYDELKKQALALPPMTDQQKAEQRLDFAYGNLAIDGKASRSAFKILATTSIDGGLGWTPEQFEAWAEGKKWDAP